MATVEKVDFIYTSSFLPMKSNGLWGNYVEFNVTRQDNVMMHFGTYSLQETYNFNVTFMDPNIWYLTVSASNYIGQAKYKLWENMKVIRGIGVGCNIPYVDITIPNECDPDTTCDSNYNEYNALRKTRSSKIILRSNTTNYCNGPVSFP